VAHVCNHCNERDRCEISLAAERFAYPHLRHWTSPTLLTTIELREVTGLNPDWVLVNAPEKFMPTFICLATFCSLT
jgi:hypothetical protein